ncbi:MAG: hypothetical protein GY758_05605 [Fuerstiella sp.]|nr:hypothetical protein [Fuerstiella sp.]MCP4509491.1 hypothetical protein [Fuerstiella sp.]
MNENPAQVIDVGALLRGWRTILFITTVAILSSGAFLITVEPQQQVGAKLIVEPRAVDIDGTKASTHDREFLPTQAEILRSPAVITSAVRSIAAEVSAEELANRILDIAANLKIDPLAGTSILQLQYTDSTAQRAADLVNALVAGYREYLATSEQQQHQEMLLLLTARDLELRSELAAFGMDYEALKQDHAGSAGADPVTAARILAGLEESLATTQSRRLLLEQAEQRLQPSRNFLLETTDSDSQSDFSTEFHSQRDAALKELKALSADVRSDVPDPTDAIERTRLARSLASELQFSLGLQHPERKAAEALVAQYDQELTRLSQTALATVQRSLATIRMQEEALQTRYDSYLLSANETKVMRLKESQKLAEIDRAQRSYEAVHAQLTQWQLVDDAMANGRAGISVSVLEPPTPAERSIAANPLIVMGLAGLLGLIFAVSWLVMLPQFKSLLSGPSPVPAAPSV